MDPSIAPLVHAAIKPHLPALLTCLRGTPDCALSHRPEWLQPVVDGADLGAAVTGLALGQRKDMEVVDTNVRQVSAFSSRVLAWHIVLCKPGGESFPAKFLAMASCCIKM